MKRACYAGLGSLELRREVARRLLAAVPADAWVFPATDPATGLVTQVLGEGLSAADGLGFVTRVYPAAEALRFIELGRSGQLVAATQPGRPAGAPFHSADFYDWLDQAGLQAEARVAFALSGTLWGTACLMREQGRSSFSPRQLSLLRRVATHVARGLQRAGLVDAAGEPEREDGRDPPAMLVLDRELRILLLSQGAAPLLEDLADEAFRIGEIPISVATLVSRLRLLHAAEDEHRPLEAAVHARGRSGRWYSLHAALAEPDADGEERATVLIRPLDAAERAPLLARLYGLSAREWQIATLVARGESTNRIARRLGISPYTVQDHLDHACEKVGVRGRKQLLGKLFFDGYLPRLAAAGT